MLAFKWSLFGHFVQEANEICNPAKVLKQKCSSKSAQAYAQAYEHFTLKDVQEYLQALLSTSTLVLAPCLVCVSSRVWQIHCNN